MDTIKNTLAFVGSWFLGGLIALNIYVVYSLAIGRNVILQKTVSILPSEEEEQQIPREIVDNKKYARR
jgi:hypothetical protein